MSIASFERVQGDVFGDVGGSDCHVISSRRSLSNGAERIVRLINLFNHGNQRVV